jgi:hypothetical protein
MPDQDAGEPTQTTPKGLEIPVPTREEFLRNMETVAPPVQPEERPSEPKPERPERD